MLLLDSESNLETFMNNFNYRTAQIEADLAEYKKTIQTDAGRENYNTFETAYADYTEYLDKIIEYVKVGNKEEANTILFSNDMKVASDSVHEALTNLISTRATNGTKQYENLVTTSNISKLVMTILSVSGVVLAIILGLLIARLISKPITMLVDAANKLAIGDIEVDIESEYNDETGKLARAFQALIGNIKDQTRLAERMAKGDFSMAVKLRSDKDILGKELNTMIENVNELMSNVVFAAEQVAYWFKSNI